MIIILTITTESEDDADTIKTLLESAMEDGTIEEPFDLHQQEDSQ